MSEQHLFVKYIHPLWIAIDVYICFLDYPKNVPPLPSCTMRINVWNWRNLETAARSLSDMFINNPKKKKKKNILEN